MCLDLTINAEKQIATEDIVCYKRILKRVDFIQHVDKLFTGIIDGVNCEGIIQIEKKENNIAYFCTDNPRLNGISCSDKLGYSYSWKFDDCVQSIIIDGIDIMNVPNLSFQTPYQLAEVNIGETYTSELILDFNSFGDSNIKIGLHSYANYIDAKKDGNNIIVKCIIPKGAEYYEGEFGRSKSYASNKLKYIEIVK